jgi:hypothetical protein
MPSRPRGHAGKPAASDEHASRKQSPTDPSQGAEASRDLPKGASGIDFQPPPSLPRSTPTRQVVTAKVTSPENSERRRQVDADQRQQQQLHRQPSSRPAPPWANIHEGPQHAQQHPHYQAGAMPFSVPRAQQQVRYSKAWLYLLDQSGLSGSWPLVGLITVFDCPIVSRKTLLFYFSVSSTIYFIALLPIHRLYHLLSTLPSRSLCAVRSYDLSRPLFPTTVSLSNAYHDY